MSWAVDIAENIDLKKGSRIADVLNRIENNERTDHCDPVETLIAYRLLQADVDCDEDESAYDIAVNALDEDISYFKSLVNALEEPQTNKETAQ